MFYRREIDGLRALAVIPVILFHGGFETFSGGFVGVDVFFVISGYLITSIIIKELEAGSFTLAGFYERRARRILPALFFILLVTLPFAWAWLLPHELSDFGKSLAAVAVFGSNILFWQQSDYFAADAEFIPLLHTWSLAVEEQFYLFFPLLLLLFWKGGKVRLVTLFLIIGLISLGFSEWAWREYPAANFYLITSRAWELMIGALTGFYLYNRQQPGGIPNQLGSLVGLLMILYAIFFIDRDLPFPGLYALIPTLGTALVILFGSPNTLVYHLLSIRPMVAVGLISYSAYLWHQPLFVFTRVQGFDEMFHEAYGISSLWLHGALGLLALLLAALSWRFVEQPFRNRQRLTRQRIFVLAATGTFIFLAIGGMLVMLDGAPFRF